MYTSRSFVPLPFIYFSQRILTYPQKLIDYSPSWEANSCSAGRKFPVFMGPGDSLPCSQEPPRDFPEPAESNPRYLHYSVV
jgi:hypothetical protein